MGCKGFQRTRGYSGLDEAGENRQFKNITQFVKSVFDLLMVCRVKFDYIYLLFCSVQ